MRRSAALAAALVVAASTSPAVGLSAPPGSKLDSSVQVWRISSTRPRPIQLGIDAVARHGTAGLLFVRLQRFAGGRHASSFLQYVEFGQHTGALVHAGDRSAQVGCEQESNCTEGLNAETLHYPVPGKRHSERWSTSVYYVATRNADSVSFDLSPGWKAEQVREPIVRFVLANREGSAGAAAGTPELTGVAPKEVSTKLGWHAESFRGAQAQGGRHGSLVRAFLPCHRDPKDPRTAVGTGQATLYGGSHEPALTCDAPEADARAYRPTTWTLFGEAYSATAKYVARLVVFDLPAWFRG